MKSVLLSILLSGTILGGTMINNQTGNIETCKGENIETIDGNKHLDIFYMYNNYEGTYWIEPSSDSENVIFIGYDALNEWNINIDTLHHGNRFTGVFDSTGWDLLRLIDIK